MVKFVNIVSVYIKKEFKKKNCLFLLDLNPCNSNPCGEGAACRPAIPSENGYICACNPVSKIFKRY